MGFLREQLGEEELRLLLERLNAFNQEEGPFDVANLMSLSEVAPSGADTEDLANRAAEKVVASTGA